MKNFKTLERMSLNKKIIFTRYLYIKEEVEYSLLLSLLNKSDDALFWAYELYYSGFQEDLIYYILKIYYDFYASLNPSFEAYLFKKINEFFENDEINENGNINEKENLKKNKIIGTIVQNLLIRNFNCDIFYIKLLNQNNLLINIFRNENYFDLLNSNDFYEYIYNNNYINVNFDIVFLEFIENLIIQRKIELLSYIVLNKQFDIFDFYKQILYIFNKLVINPITCFFVDGCCFKAHK